MYRDNRSLWESCSWRCLGIRILWICKLTDHTHRGPVSSNKSHYAQTWCRHVWVRPQDHIVVFFVRFKRSGCNRRGRWLAEFGNRRPWVCGRVGVSAGSSGMLSAAQTAELSVSEGFAILNGGEKSEECDQYNWIPLFEGLSIIATQLIVQLAATPLLMKTSPV